MHVSAREVSLFPAIQGRGAALLRLLACAGGLVAAGAASAQAFGPADLGAGDSPFTIAGPRDQTAVYLRGVTVQTDEPRRLGDLVAGRDRAAAARQRVVIQLDGPMTETRRAALTGAGLNLEIYLPLNAWAVTVSPDADPAALNGLGFVRWASDYQASWKIDPEMGTRQYLAPERQAFARAGQVLTWIYLFPGEDANAVADAVRTLNGATLTNVTEVGGKPLVVAAIRPADAARIAEIPSVQFIEEALEATERNNTSRTVVQSGTGTLTPLYANGLIGEGQVVGVIDSKININHCSFRDPVSGGTAVPIGPAHRKLLAYNTTTGSASHGTHVAGTIAGDGGAFNDTRGVAYGAKIVFHDIPNDSTTGNTFLSRLNLHHSQGARIHTNSWGADFTTAYNGWAWAVDKFSRDNEDSVVAFAVSNQSLLYTPENAKSCLAVGATQDWPNINNHCSGGQGPTADQRRKPETYAPGCGTTSSSSSTTCGTTSLTGTSMACPAVSGAATLMREYFTDGYYPTGAPVVSNAFTPTGALIRAAVINASVDMTGVPGYPSNREGWGRLVADNALFFPGDARTLLAYDVRNDAPESLVTGTNWTQEFEVTGSTEQLRLTLTFTDVPAALNASFAPVNDINLEVTAPNGDVYRGNVFLNGVSTTGGVFDAVNSTEQVHVTNPAAGVWTVRVLGQAVNQFRQGFGLIITGQVAEATGCVGDINGDGIVGFEDLNTVLNQFGQSGSLSGDINGDGTVNFEDLNLLLANYGCGAP